MTVLLTGAAGLVGAEVAARLIESGETVIALVHDEPRIVRNDGSVVAGVETVRGDIRAPMFGLATDAVRAIGSRVDVLVHCAATTAFDATDDAYRRLNVDGAAHAIELARAWSVPLVQVSTAYVCGLRDGTVAEDALDAGQSFGNGYERSKFEAERLVRAAAADGLHTVVIRPGIVTGATATGAIRDYKNLYTVVKLMVEGKLRTLPGRYDATLSLAPVDHVADVVVAAALRPDTVRGQTIHTVGRDRLSLREVSDVLAEYPSFEVATFVPAASFDEGALGPIEREYYRRIGSLYTSYFVRRIGFEIGRAETLLGRPAPDSGKDYLRLLLDHCLDTGYLGVPLPSIEDVLAGLGGGAR